MRSFTGMKKYSRVILQNQLIKYVDFIKSTILHVDFPKSTFSTLNVKIDTNKICCPKSTLIKYVDFIKSTIFVC